MRYIVYACLMMSVFTECRQDLVDQMASCIRLNECPLMHDLRAVVQQYKQFELPRTADRPLMHAYPALSSLAHVPLADLPTAIEKLSAFSAKYDDVAIYIKRDDQTGMLCNGRRLFGGNKVRKLEFLLGDACDMGCKTVLTFGCVGSNHATATAFYASLLGLRCVVMLAPEPNSHCVRRNIAIMQQTGADLHFCTTTEMRSLGTAYTCARYALDYGSYPYCIPTGGSCPRGALGYVNAAFELKEQIEQGVMPMPDVIYVAAGSAGTTVGLLLGLCLAEMPIKIVAVATEPEGAPGALQHKIEQLFYQTNEFMRSYDASCPECLFPIDQVRVETGFCGPRYAEFTQEGVAAQWRMQQLENIELDGVYTGKACAALCHDLQQGSLKNQTVLFWNTFYACPFQEPSCNIAALPLGLRAYFINDVQPLDQQ